MAHLANPPNSWNDMSFLGGASPLNYLFKGRGIPGFLLSFIVFLFRILKCALTKATSATDQAGNL